MPADTVVLLLPGMSLNATIFPHLDGPTLATDFHAFAPPTPGMAPYVAEVDTLTTHPSWTQAQNRVVVAHSFGGMLALSWLLARSPTARLTTGLVLIGTTAGPMYDAVRLRVAGWGDHEIRVPIAPLIRLWNNPTVTRTMQRLMNAGSLQGHGVDFRTLPYTDDIRIGIAGWHATSWEARRAFREAMRGFDVRERLGEIDVPGIVLHGTRDCYFTTRVAEALAHGLRADLRLVRDAGHVLPLTHGDEVVRAVHDLASRSPQPAPSAASSA
jgi:pimeloyl-ACP methyl ester carboxylesterase